jgi:threonine/homoserine/homoserine lactone efflux protein
MLALPPIIVAALAGFFSGLLFSSIPVGPINLTIINEGARRGFWWAMLIGLGATAMEVIYCTISFTGFSTFFSAGIVKSLMEVFGFLFLIFLGGKFLMAKSINMPSKLGEASKKFEEPLDQKLHPHSAFMTGFVRVMGNLGVFAFWLVLAANFMSHDWVSAGSFSEKAVCITGVALGMICWFVIFSFGVSCGHGRFSELTLLRMQHFSGVCLLTLGLIHGGHIAWQLAKHNRSHHPRLEYREEYRQAPDSNSN